ncbi:hypothetical protein GCM10009000_079480 [Halobacterium noricense]|uniref:Uncharacterized protein n=1 Tax=Haladaptatus pallidirubidus TaxID=1008152 RepID=A0AAV3UNW3_9EURY
MLFTHQESVALVEIRIRLIFVVLYCLGHCMANLIVKSVVKEHLGDKNVASDFYDALDDEVCTKDCA